MKYHNHRHLCRLALLFALIGVVSGCVTDDTYIVNHTPQSDTPINISANIKQQYATRANDGGFADGDNIGVFIVNYNGTQPQELQLSGNHADNVEFTYHADDGKWVGASPIYWEDINTTIDAYGYYPYDAELSSVVRSPFAVRRDQNASEGSKGLLGYELSDFLWAKSENIAQSNREVTLNHTHIMAGIQITLVEGYGFDAGEWNSLTKKVTINNTKLKAYISLQTGDVEVDTSADVEDITPMLSATNYRAIVVPQSIEPGKTLITVDIGDTTYEHKRAEATVYNPGKLHRFTLQVSKRLPSGDYTFNLIDESILPWQNDPVSHNGSVREYIKIHVNDGEYIGDVVAKMGLIPESLISVKLTGVLTGDRQFEYIRQRMVNLEAVHMKELRTKEQLSYKYGSIGYDQPQVADDYIPYNAFYQMKYLSYVVWPDHLVGIGEAAFAGCNLRGALILPEGLKHIGNNVFEAYGCQNSALSGELYLPTTLEYIGSGVFNPCDGHKCNLTGVFSLPANIKYIGADAFGPCHYLTGIMTIPESLDRLERGAFPENLTGDVTIPKGIKYVGGLSSKISSVSFHEEVEEIGPYAFSGIKTMRGDIYLPSSIKKIGEGAFSESNIAHVRLPEQINTIEKRLFSWCTNLQDTVRIPDSVETIGDHAFYRCEKLAGVILSENLRSIDMRAFAECKSLEYIECRSAVPPTANPTTFDYIEKNNITLVVPAEAVEAYKTAEVWREFKRISAYRNFVCRPMKAELLNRGDVRTIVLNADGAWRVSESPSWAQPSVTEGYKKTQLSVTIDDLPHGAGYRSGSIVFTLLDKFDDDGNPITCSYDIAQYDYQYDEDSQLVLQRATKGNNGGINITFVGDGYSAKDIGQEAYLADVKEGVEYLFGIEPYTSYREYFNVNVAFALSYDSGVCSDVNIWRQTKFNTIYGAGSNQRLATQPEEVMSYVLEEVEGSSITSENVNQSLVICILNSDVYEGITSLYASGAAVAFIPHCRNSYPNDYRGLMQHEAGGHGFGKLADEYIYSCDHQHIAVCQCPCCGHISEINYHKNVLGWYRNISLANSYLEIEWRHLIFHPDYDDIVDIYEGAYMHPRGVYRSEISSCMNDNIPYYNTISRQAIVERIKAYAGEEFSFDEFVANDSSEYGPLTRTSNGCAETSAMHNPAPIFISGSPLDYIKIKE